jgi:hypothetical protein
MVPGHMQPTFPQLKKSFLDSGYEIRRISRKQLELLALGNPQAVKSHQNSNIMGVIAHDTNLIAIAADLTEQEAAETLLHELVHLWDESLAEDEVIALSEQAVGALTPGQYGFLQFLVAY